MTAAPRSLAKYLLALAIAVAVLALDQASKWWILERVMQPPRIVPAAPFLDLVLVWNRGITFGLFNAAGGAQPLAFTALAGIVAVGLLIWLRRAERIGIAAAIGAILGGAIGNVLDRLRFGAVVDFIDAHLAGWHWPAFNVADSAITIAVCWIALDALFGAKE